MGAEVIEIEDGVQTGEGGKIESIPRHATSGLGAVGVSDRGDYSFREADSFSIAT